ncbi:glycine betaine ABC transporter substrate-binding protein [Cupriavidus plantarum]|uniref:glycine betaine ABC transporter substrate-binding protein n=1 Tax=Cupriavidus plantarum TaxID=942865 RepID=UPI000E25839F|nr:glycine betaine ABC transporter substrate-binding protein [Cupriavidus plantarum]
MRMSADITIVTIDLSFHRAATGLVRATLEDHGVTTRELLAPHERAFELFAAGEADLLCSAWLPSSHEIYLAPIAQEVEKLTVLYRPFAFWGVPDYVPIESVRAIGDLAHATVVARMTKRLQGIGPGAGISRFSRVALERYGLAQHGYHFENGTLDDCVTAYEHAVAAGEWVVVPLWQPQYLHETHRIRPLEDPLGIMGTVDDATLVARKDRLGKLPSAAVEALRKLRPGNATISKLDYLVSRQHRDPIDAAREAAAR